MIKLKTCGLFRNEDIDYANESKPDFIGFVFAKSTRRISPEKAAQLKARLDPNIKAAGVFVNSPVSFPLMLYKTGVIDIIQLHGAEDENYISFLKTNSNAPIIKALKVTSGDDILNAENTAADYLLLDSGTGSGVRFDWSIIKNINKPWFLAGGINPENIDKALSLRPYGIDISSGIETNGVKDRKKIIFIANRIKDFNKSTERIKNYV